MIDSIEELVKEFGSLLDELKKIQSLHDSKVQIDDFEKWRDRLID